MNLNDKPAWNFPSLNGGQDVVQDSASEFFTDNPIAKLVRETIQNSLDAKKDGLPLVKVTFTESVINRDLFDGAGLRKHLRACHERVVKDGLDREIGRFYQEADRTLSKNVRVLSIVDTGTTGLDSEAKWKALVRQEGAVNKEGAASGGSFGIGKNAVFNVSALRAVLYSTRYLGKTKRERRKGVQEKMQAKSTLMSHPSPDGAGDLQHVGFLEWPTVRSRSDLPSEFRLDEPGTGVFILGFEPQVGDREWIDEMLRAVVENFFCAIHDEKLAVEIKSRGARTETASRETIGSCFERLYPERKPKAYYYHRAISGGANSVVEVESPLGDLRLRLLADEGPKETAYVNRMGMLISDSRDQKINPVSPRRRALWPDFAAVVVPCADRGDSWSRRMETPSHDAVSPERLKDPREREKAKRIFQDARRAIRAAIDEALGIGESGEESNVYELSEILPDEFDPSVPGNRALKSKEEEPRPLRLIEDDEEEDGPEPKPEPSPDRRTRRSKRVSQPQPKARLGRPRYIASGEDTHSCVVAFDLNESAERITLSLTPAGAEQGERMAPVKIASASLFGRELDCGEDGAVQIVNPPAGQRLSVKIKTAESIANRAIVARGVVKA